MAISQVITGAWASLPNGRLMPIDSVWQVRGDTDHSRRFRLCSDKMSAALLLLMVGDVCRFGFSVKAAKVGGDELVTYQFDNCVILDLLRDIERFAVLVGKLGLTEVIEQGLNPGVIEFECYSSDGVVEPVSIMTWASKP